MHEEKSPRIILRPNTDDLERGSGDSRAAAEFDAKSSKRWIAVVRSWGASLREWLRASEKPAKWFRVRNIDQCAHGYPRLTAFVDSDPNFLIYQRFGYLRTRVLLHHQDVLLEKERQLDKFDEESASSARTEAYLCSRTKDENQPDPKRRDLFKQLDKDFRAYDELLLRSAELYKLDKPVSKNRESVAHLIWADGQIFERDRQYIQHTDDLVTLGGDREHSWVHLLFEAAFTRSSRRLSKKLFQNKTQAAKTKSPELSIYLYSKARFDFVVACLFTTIITAFVIGPVFVLTIYMDLSYIVKDAIILAHTLLFAMVCSICTTAKRHEIFAATAAYAAVLVVFISQGPGRNELSGAAGATP